jgi:hypothetical protein
VSLAGGALLLLHLSGGSVLWGWTGGVICIVAGLLAILGH